MSVFARKPVATGSAAPTGTGVCLAGVVVAIALLTRGSKEEAEGPSTMHVWKRYPAIEGMPVGDESRGPDYKMWVKQYRKASHAPKYRSRYWRQKKVLKESNVWWASSKFVHWYPNRDKFNMYKGPDSHPNNPYFPAASDGWQAVRSWAPAQLAATSTLRSGSVFVAGSAPTVYSAKRAAVPRGAVRSSIVMHAHKKAASCSKNQGGGSSNPSWLGLKLKGYHGCAIKCGDIILKQTGCNWWPGQNVVMGKDFTIHATKDGIVQWRGRARHKQVSVVPWDYVREKCVWINPSTLGPKVYEPWMGTAPAGKRVAGARDHVLKVREEWLQTEEGKAWQEKKQEKEKAQKEIQRKIRAYRKLRKQGLMPAEAKAKVESVLASVDSGSEAEK